MGSSDILKVIPTLQAAGMVEHNYNYLKKKKKKTGDLFGLAGYNITGSALIKAEGDFL